MAMGSADRYRRLFAYEKDAHGKVLASLQTVPASRHNDETYEQALELFGHMIAARWFWLYRFGVISDKPKDMFPKHVTLEELAQRAEAAYEAWDAYLGHLDDDELTRTFEYQATEGDWYRNTIEDILTQLAGHSWYHRGQIASRIKACGGTPTSTDFVFWTRELIPEKN